MKALKTGVVFLFITVFFACSSHDNATDRIILKVLKKEQASVYLYAHAKGNPRSVDKKGKVVFSVPSDWTSGFYPGCLWYSYELSKDTLFLHAAENHTKVLENQKYNNTTHDMGFKMYCSYGNGYRLTRNKKYRKILLESAKTLATRFNPKVGCIRSWDHHANQWGYPVIIDNMMNLELLFWAFDQTHDSLYYTIAISHANKTMQNHFRKDYSSWHVVDYDTITGKVIKKTTHQGYSDSSDWARGQAWGLYGFTMAYRYTKEKKYLDFAKHIARFILNNPKLPKDKVPYWDYDAPDIPQAPRDASAAAITSSALYELSTYTSGKESKYYFKNAEDILNSLCAKYLTPPGYNYFLLEHSTGNWPSHSEINAPIIYADYYFLESLVRRRDIHRQN